MVGLTVETSACCVLWLPARVTMGALALIAFSIYRQECEGRLVAHDLRRLRGVPVLGLEDCRRGVLLVAVGLCAELGLELRLRKEETTSDSRRPRAGSAAEWPVRVHHKCWRAIRLVHATATTNGQRARRPGSWTDPNQAQFSM